MGKDEKRECTFVFIGRDLDHEALEAGFMECKAEELRFKEGDMIYANIGEFTKGKILKCWDEGNPYRVEIQDEEKKMFGFLLMMMNMYERQIRLTLSS